MTAFDYLKNFMIEAFHTTAQPNARQTLHMHARQNSLLNRQPAPTAVAPLKVVLKRG